MTDERARICGGPDVDRCPTECPTVDHVRVTPAEERETVDLANVGDG